MKIDLSPIISITRGPRLTSMELLRIVAMFMVLIVHADFVSLGAPKASFDTLSHGTTTMLKVIFEMAAVGGVNVFVLISGWFGIKPTVKGFVNFMAQVLFFFIFTYLVMLCFSMAKFNGQTIAACFCMGNSHWFIKAYAALYLLAPMLNYFVEKCSQRQLRNVVIGFFIYQTIWGFFSPNPTVNNGYSVFSFIGLYLLARYMRLYYHGTRRGSWLALYAVARGLCVVAFFTFPSWLTVTSLANPLVIIGSFALLMFFTRLEMRQNVWINFIAASSFGVYLLHTAPAVMVHFRRLVVWVYNHTPSLLCLVTIAMVLVMFYAIAIVIDQLRLWLWNSSVKQVDKFVASINTLLAK